MAIAHRSYIFSMLLFFLFCNSLNSTDIHNTFTHRSLVSQEKNALHAQQWTDYLVAYVEPENIQVVANIIYLLYANAVIDIKVRQFVIPITRLNQAIRSNIVNYKNTEKELTTLKTLLDRLSYIMSARTIYNQMLTTCLNYYNQHQWEPLSQMILELQTYGQQSLNEFAQTNRDALSEVLKSSAKVFTDGVQPLQNLSKIYETIADGTMPESLKSNDSTKEIVDLVIIDELLKSNIAATQNSEYILNTLDNSTDIILRLIATATEIYKEHYQALYGHMFSDTFDQRYAHTLFGINDMLPQEYQSLLPHPDKVFEHVLQTIKLYTQTEYIQNQ